MIPSLRCWYALHIHTLRMTSDRTAAGSIARRTRALIVQNESEVLYQSYPALSNSTQCELKTSTRGQAVSDLLKGRPQVDCERDVCQGEEIADDKRLRVQVAV